ncbi:hypothetical protein ABIF38_004341 [Bradyrhizobium japonicum]|nr:hypothetical protein [Bradyrhizobium elkanii]MCS3568681.1 hypothetical protein [Bradyrhizobium elkanii]MCS3589835.1 hypothetical protein [Bradyrhizobium elkanii]MCS3619277.1 hypothetical protein [Bradyrhizobium elkanii]MCW2112525.1 hypothetical protein [Bradyrhizobium elkanii]
MDARFGELEAEIERLEAKRQAYDPADVARGGAFVVLNHDGTVRIERGFIRPEDEKPEAETGPDSDADARDEEDRDGEEGALDGEDDEATSDELPSLLRMAALHAQTDLQSETQGGEPHAVAAE